MLDFFDSLTIAAGGRKDLPPAAIGMKRREPLIRVGIAVIMPVSSAPVLSVRLK